MKKTIITCDKCGKEIVHPNTPTTVTVGVGDYSNYNGTFFHMTVKKDFCRECLVELFPKVVSFNGERAETLVCEKTTSEKFVEILKELIAEEIPES